MKVLKFKLLFLTIAVMLSIVSCSDDDNGGSITPVNESPKVALFLITNPKQFNGLLIPSRKMFSGKVDPSKISDAKQLGQVRTAGISYNGSIYHTSNVTGDGGIQKLTYTNNKFKDNGFIAVQERRFMFDIVSNTKGYYTDAGRSTTAIQTFNPTTMERTGEIDIAQELKPLINDKVKRTRLGAFMVHSKGKLYTQVFFFNDKGLHVYDTTYVAVFDTNTNKFIGLATHNDYIWLGFERKNSNYVGIAENGDIYLSGITGNIKDGSHSRCLRIKAGENNFDNSWKLDFNNIIGKEGSFSMGGPAVFKNKLYIRLKETPMAINYSNVAEENISAYEIDITTKQAKKIAKIPSSGATRFSPNGPVVIDNKVYFAVSNTKYQGYYTYNPTNKKVEEVFSLSGGIPSQLIELK